MITIVDGDTADVSSDTDDTSNGDKAEPVNIKSYKDVNTDEFYYKRGKDYIYYKPAVERYGRIFKFQSTPSARRATFGCGVDGICQRISIHTFREEGDNDWRCRA